MKYSLLVSGLLIALYGCGPERSVTEPKDALAIPITINCTTKYDVDYSTLPVLGSYDQTTALKLAQNFLGFVSCQQSFPNEFYFKPYFFDPDDIHAPYTAVLFSEGFNKQPGLLKVTTENGPTLLFCFNRMVINCDQAVNCDCPYDFNREPEQKSPQ